MPDNTRGATARQASNDQPLIRAKRTRTGNLPQRHRQRVARRRPTAGEALTSCLSGSVNAEFASPVPPMTLQLAGEYGKNVPKAKGEAARRPPNFDGSIARLMEQTFEERQSGIAKWRKRVGPGHANGLTPRRFPPLERDVCDPPLLATEHSQRAGITAIDIFA